MNDKAGWRKSERDKQDSLAHISPISTARELAYVGTAGQIFAYNLESAMSRQLTWHWPTIDTRASESQGPYSLYPVQTPTAFKSHDDGVDHTTYSWPTWSPKGERIACFGHTSSNRGAQILTVTSDGAESVELVNTKKGSVIYGNWSSDAKLFTFIAWYGDGSLSLESVLTDAPEEPRVLLNGGPLFWSWSPTRPLLAVHSSQHSQPNAGRVLILDPYSGEVVQEVTNSAGYFRTPSWCPEGDLLAYAERNTDGTQSLRLFNTDGETSVPVTVTNGSVAALWSPEGRSLAYASNLHPNEREFSALCILDLSSGRTKTVLDAPMTGFAWAENGDSLVYTTRDRPEGPSVWNYYHLEAKERVEIARFAPTNEQKLHQTFFDQYSTSHALTDLSGTMLTFAGNRVGPNNYNSHEKAMVYVVHLAPPFDPLPVTTGTLPCWRPLPPSS